MIATTTRYTPAMGVLPTVTLYTIKRKARVGTKHRDATPAETLYNWRLEQTNHEPMSSGTGEKWGAFKSVRSAWNNLRTTMLIFGGYTLNRAVIAMDADIVILDNGGEPALRIRRVALR